MPADGRVHHPDRLAGEKSRLGSFIGVAQVELPGVAIWPDFFLIRRARSWAGGKLQTDAQTAALASGKGNVSTMLPYDRTGDCETESDTARVGVARVFNPVEWFEDLLTLAPRNTGSLVVYRGTVRNLQAGVEPLERARPVDRPRFHRMHEHHLAERSPVLRRLVELVREFRQRIIERYHSRDYEPPTHSL